MADHGLDNAIFELTEAHRLLTALCFNNELNPIKIAIEHKRRSDSKILGRFQAGNFYNKDKSIIILHTSLFNGNYQKIIETLIHEMIHQYCDEHSMISSHNNNRHNKNFRDIGEMVGFIFSKTNSLSDENLVDRKKFGFMHHTGITNKLFNIINNLTINRAVLFNLVHEDAKATNDQSIKTKNVYQCQCGTIITNKNELWLKCLVCGEEFQKIKSV